MKALYRPQKSLGQHFLRDALIAGSIVDSLELEQKDSVLEIGPGEGVLTDLILKKTINKFTAVELDHKLAMWLQIRHKDKTHFKLIEGDILKQDIPRIADREKLRIVGNLPYNITSPILFKLLEHRQEIQDITIMIQKEVALRLASQPSCKSYGIPSVFFQLHARVDHLLDVPPEAFYPVPAVNSAVIRLTFYQEPLFDIADYDLFRKLVKTTFNQRRKMLRNTLKTFVPDIQNSPVRQYAELRPEQLTVEEWANLSNEITKLQSGN